jgi:hypothetical protein
MKFARYEHTGAVRDGVLGSGDLLHELATGQDVDDLIKRGGRGALLLLHQPARLRGRV